MRPLGGFLMLCYGIGGTRSLLELGVPFPLGANLTGPDTFEINRQGTRLYKIFFAAIFSPQNPNEISHLHQVVFSAFIKYNLLTLMEIVLC